MTALVSFAQDFQDFHLVRGDRFAPFNAKSRDCSRDCSLAECFPVLDLDAGFPVYLRTTVIMHDSSAQVKSYGAVLGPISCGRDVIHMRFPG